MKELVKFESPMGGDGGKVGGALGVEETDLKLTAYATYPIEKIIEPATKALDDALDKLEKAIPGDWDKPYIEKIKEEYKKKIVELLAAQAG